MNTTDYNLDSQSSIGGKVYFRDNSNPYLVLIKKTFIFDICTWKKLVISISLMILVPILILVFWHLPSNSDEVYLVQLLGYAVWYYNFSIMLPIIIISVTSPLISEEIRTGTMLFLVSKPINRILIILSKFIALFLFGIIVSILSLSIISIVAFIKYPFNDIGAFFGIFSLYSLCTIFFFGALTMAFSSIFRRPRNVLLIPLALVIFTFFIIMMFKPMLLMTEDNWYEIFQLYHFDIGYHFSNIFLWFGEFYVPGFLDYYADLFWMFGIVTTEDFMNFEKTNYYYPPLSVIYLIIIAVVILILGIIRFKMREIS